MNKDFSEIYSRKMAELYAKTFADFTERLGIVIDDCDYYHLQVWNDMGTIWIYRGDVKIGEIQTRTEFTERGGLRFIVECKEIK
jgi:hypothetical protein